MLASAGGHVDVVRILVEAKADVTLQNHVICRPSNPLESGSLSGVGCGLQNNCTALMEAIRGGSAAAVHTADWRDAGHSV
jgi:hypothetical protein